MKKTILNKIIKIVRDDKNIVSLINFLFGVQFITPYLALYMESQLQSLSQVALIFSLQSAAMILFELPTGISSDILGRKKSLVISGLIQILSLIILYFASNILGFIFYAILQGIIIGFSNKASESYIYETLILENSQSEFKKHFTNVYGMWSLGATFSSIIASLFSFYGIKSLILGSILISCLIPYFALFIKNINVHRKKQNYFKNVKKILKHTLLKKSLTPFILFNIFYLGVFDEVLKLKSILFSSKIVSFELIGLFTALFYFMTATGLRTSYYLSKRLSDYKTFLLGLSGFITSIAFAATTSGFLSIFIFALAGFFFSINRPVISHVINNNISNQNRATTISIFELLTNFAQLSVGIWISFASLSLNIQDIYLLMSLLIFVLLFLFRKMFILID